MFSIMLENETTINFLAKDKETASYWIDGFSLLLGRNNKIDLQGSSCSFFRKRDQERFVQKGTKNVGGHGLCASAH